MIDSHSHIYAQEFDSDIADVIARAQQAGVSHIVLPNENLSTLPRLQHLHQAYPSYVSMAIGLHPEEIGDNDYRDQLNAMQAMIPSGNFVAVGEIGIDLYWDSTWRQQQIEALDTQLRWCADYNLPFIIHCRNGIDEVLQVFSNFGRQLPQGVFHCFTGNADDIRRIRHYGDFYFGVGGIVTFKKSEVPQILPTIGINRLLLETDSPYLAPVPHRGTRNESAYIPLICHSVATHLGISPADVSRITDDNARRLFQLPATD